MGVWPRARTATGGAGWPRSHVRVSVAWSWSKAGGLSAVARGCPRWAVSAPGPRGERRARSSPDRGAQSPVLVRGCSWGRFGVHRLGKAETHCLPAAVLRGAGDCKA